MLDVNSFSIFSRILIVWKIIQCVLKYYNMNDNFNLVQYVIGIELSSDICLSHLVLIDLEILRK